MPILPLSISIICSYYFWHLMDDLLSKVGMNEKHKLNIMSVINALIIIMCVIYNQLNYIGNINASIICTVYPVGYYANDSVRITKTIHNNFLTKITYLFHHVISIIIITWCVENNNIQIQLIIFGLIEFSNLPVCFVYYLKHSNYNKDIIKFFTIVEIATYGFIRIFIGGMIILSQKTNILFIMIYVLSLIWWIAMIKQL